MSSTTYYWDEDDDNVCCEEDENGEITASYTHEPGLYGEVIAQKRGDEVRYFNFDGEGNTSELTDDDQNVTDTYEYSAFGEEVARTGTTENPFGYKGALGYYANPETNDFYVRDRVFEPNIARWQSEDSLGFAAGINRYAFSNNNPLLFVDPSGMASLCCDGVERETELVYKKPAGAPSTRGGITITDIRAFRPSMCGGFSWAIQWNLQSQSGDGGGYILQHIQRGRFVYDCNGNLVDDHVDEFWEAFVIGKNKKLTLEMQFGGLWDDEFAGKRSDICTKGTDYAIGIYHYVDGPLPKPPFVDGGCAGAGILPCTKVDPKIPIANWGEHSIHVKWDCC